MGEGDLTPVLVYECNDIPIDSIPLENIKYLGVSVMNLTNIQLVTQLKSLQLVTFRLCALTQFPAELWQLPQLRSIDISGNAISQLPESPKWAEMIELTSFNISENNINELSEFRNIIEIPNLKQLNFTGNVCQGANDAQNRIVKIFPKIVVVNETIILSQHRGYLDEVAIFDNTSVLPLSKTDDFFFNYVKYMHATGMERYLRRFNAECFCLNKVLRKYSAAEKIQSNFRGFIQRKIYIKMRECAIVIQYHIHKWYKKRLESANVIKRAFLHFLTKQKIKLIKAARVIQSRWRAKQVAEFALIELFSSNDRIEFFVTPHDAKFLEDFCREKQFANPSFIHTREYKLLRQTEPTKLILPGSPIVYYSLDNSLVIRHMNKTRNISPDKTIWCNHDHKHMKMKMMVNQHGFNFTSLCPFATLSPSKYRKPLKKINAIDKSQYLILCYFEKLSDFMQIFHTLHMNDSHGVRFIPIRNVPTIASTVCIQSSMRTFITRMHNFHQIRQDVLHKRALQTIRCFVGLMRMKKIMDGVKRTHYFREKITKLSYFYVRDTFLRELFYMKPIIPLHFGYSTDREIVLKDGNSPILNAFLPHDNADVKEADLSSVLKFGASVSQARTTYFADPQMITDKFLRRYGFHRVSFATAEEAAHRAILLSWVATKSNWCYFEEDIVDFCAATKIKNAWIGHTTRRIIFHMAAQQGKKINVQAFIYRPVDYRLKMQLMQEDQNKRKKPVSTDINIEEQIDILRGVYQPWKYVFDQYKKDYGTELVGMPEKPKRREKELTSSMRLMGTINELLPPEPEPEPELTIPSPKMTALNTTPRTATPLSPDQSKIMITPVRSANSPLFETRPKTGSIKPSTLKRIVGFDSSQSITANSFGGAPVEKLIEKSTSVTFEIAPSPSQQIKTSQSTIVDPIPFPERANTSLQNSRKASLSNQTSQIIAKPILKIPITQMQQVPTPTNSSYNKPKSANNTLAPLRDVKSAQRSDYTAREHTAEVFGRLSQLLKVTDAVHQAAIHDTTLEEKRANTTAARNKIVQGYANTHKMLEQNASDSHSRAKIEREERLNEAEKVKKKAMEQKVTAARQVRKDHATRRENVMVTTIFAQNFVSTTHQLASRVEGRILKANKRKERELVQTQMAAVREQEKLDRQEYKEIVKEMKESKLELAKYDRDLYLEEKKQREKGLEDKKERLATAKSALKQATLTRSLNATQKPYIPPDKIETAVFDDVELMAAEAPKLIGANVGTHESHLLSELMSSAMN